MRIYQHLYLGQMPIEIIRRQLVHKFISELIICSVAVGLVHEQPILTCLELKLNIRRNEIDLALLDLYLLAIGSHSSTAPSRQQDSVATNLLKRILLAAFKSHLQHIELTHRWREELGFAVLAALVRLWAKHAVFRAVRVERQGRDEQVCGGALGFGAEAGVEDVVAARHALDDVAG